MSNLKLLGLSGDCRTQVWQWTCLACGKDFTPRTTVLAWQEECCPKCEHPMRAEYNAEPPTLRSLPE